jgi:hypothetical protein
MTEQPSSLALAKHKRSGLDPEGQSISRVCFLISILGLSLIGAHARSPASPKSPKEVVEEFWKIETDGGTLTLVGWSKASSFLFALARPARTLSFT